MTRYSDPGWTGHAKSGVKRRRNANRYQQEFTREFDKIPSGIRRKAKTVSKPRAYRILAGATALVKKKGKDGWKEHITSKNLTFKTYNNRNREEHTFDFYEGDWIIRIHERLVKIDY